MMENEVEFMEELEKLCRHYKISISHEDCHGSFKFVEFNEADLLWIKGYS